MSTRHLLYQRNLPVNQHISIYMPTVGEVVDNEDDYYDLVGKLTAMPVDCMVDLDDAGIDFTTIDEYQLFLLMFEGLKKRDTRMVFGDLDLKDFELAINEQNGLIILEDKARGIRIDKAIHAAIANTLRKMHHLEKNRRRPANEDAKKYMLERARKKMRRNRGRITESHLEQLIIAMVNTEQFKYDFEGTRELSIYQFNESVRQIINKIEYDNRMIGVYAGTVNAKDLSPDDLNWLTHK